MRECRQFKFKGATTSFLVRVFDDLTIYTLEEDGWELLDELKYPNLCEDIHKRTLKLWDNLTALIVK
jgi:hypothetical protein